MRAGGGDGLGFPHVGIKRMYVIRLCRNRGREGCCIVDCIEFSDGNTSLSLSEV